MAKETILVASKLPHALLCRVAKVDKATAQEESSILFTLQGIARKFGAHSNIENGVALTQVSKEDWEAFKATGHPAIASGNVFAAANPLEVKAEAREKTDLKTGFEPLDPRKPGPGIQPADSMAKVGISA